jgi:hypothetical protein
VNFHQFMECSVAMFRRPPIRLSFLVGVFIGTLTAARSCNCEEPQFGEWPKMELRVPESTADGRIIGDLSDYLPNWMSFSADPATDSGPFVIEPSGIVRLAQGTRLDYETRSIYRLIVRASPVEIERDPLFESFAAILQADGITEQGIAKLQSHVRRFAVRISIEDEPESAATETPLPEPDPQASDVGSTILPPAPVVTVDATSPAPASENPVVSDSKPAPVLMTTPIPLRPNRPVRLQPHTSQSAQDEGAAATTTRNESAPDDGERITRDTSLRIQIAAIILIFGLGYLLKRVQRPVPDAAEEAAFEEKVVDEIEARIAASFTPVKAPELEAAVAKTREINSNSSREVDDENECSTESNYVLDEAGDFDIPAAPTIRDPESLVGAEYYNVEEPFIITEDNAERRRTEQLQELQSCLDERNQRIVNMERQMQALRGKLEQVTAHLALRAGGPTSDGSTTSDLENPLLSFTEVTSCENDSNSVSNCVNPEDHRDSQANRRTASSDSVLSDSITEESSALNSDHGTTAASATLRTELAELFGMQSSRVSAADSPDKDSVERSAEETHQDSVATYLDGLLQRSQNTSESEGQSNSRGRTQKATGHGGEKQSPQKRGQAPSYIESWLQDHPNPAAISDAKSEESTSQSSSGQPLAPRRPVDVEAARGHMKSLRQVAIQSAQQAVGESRLRTARNRLIRRTLLLIGLSLIAILAVVTDVFRRLSESSLGSTIWAILILTTAVLCLRIDSIRRHRHEMMTRLREDGFLLSATSPHSRFGSATQAPSAPSGLDEPSGQLPDPQSAKLNG